MNFRQHLGYGNFLRTLATIFVVIIHASGDLLYNFPKSNSLTSFFSLHLSSDVFSWLTANFFNSLSRFAVPIFIMLSGATLLNPHKNEPLGFFFRKRFFKIAPPFLFWSFVYAFYSCGELLVKNLPIPVELLLHKFFFGETFHHLWFIPMIFGLYLLTPILRVYLKTATKSDIEYFLVLWFISTSISSYFPEFILVKYLGWLGYIGFFLAGFYFSHYEFTNIKLLYFLGISSILITFLGTIFISFYTQNLYEGFFLYLSPTCILASFAIFIYVQNLYFKKSSLSFFNNRLVDLISEHSFGIYLSHLFVIEYLKHGYLGLQIYNNNFMGYQLPSYLAILILTFFTLLISFSISFAFKKIPLLKMFV